MPTVALKALTLPPSPDGYQYYDQIVFTPGSPPERPRPQPPEPPTGDPPRPMFPIAGGPDPGWPNKPGYPDYITGWPVPPGGWEPPKPDEPPGQVAVVKKAPEGAPATPPEGLQLTAALVDFGKGTKPAAAWIAPYPSTGPVEPPA